MWWKSDTHVSQEKMKKQCHRLRGVYGNKPVHIPNRIDGLILSGKRDIPVFDTRQGHMLVVVNATWQTDAQHNTNGECYWCTPKAMLCFIQIWQDHYWSSTMCLSPLSQSCFHCHLKILKRNCKNNNWLLSVYDIWKCNWGDTRMLQFNCQNSTSTKSYLALK